MAAIQIYNQALIIIIIKKQQQQQQVNPQTVKN